jgi:hypothetical protein
LFIWEEKVVDAVALIGATIVAALDCPPKARHAEPSVMIKLPAIRKICFTTLLALYFSNSQAT